MNTMNMLRSSLPVFLLGLIAFTPQFVDASIEIVPIGFGNSSCSGAVISTVGPSFYEDAPLTNPHMTGDYAASEWGSTTPYPNGFIENPQNFCFEFNLFGTHPGGSTDPTGSFFSHTWATRSWYSGSNTSSFTPSYEVSGFSLASGSAATTFQLMSCSAYVAPSCSVSEQNYVNYSAKRCSGGTEVYSNSWSENLNTGKVTGTPTEDWTGVCQAQSGTCCAYSEDTVWSGGEPQSINYSAKVYTGEATPVAYPNDAYVVARFEDIITCSGGNTSSCIPLGADVTAGAVIPTSVVVGQPVTFSSTMTNIGSGEAAASPYIPSSFQIVGGPNLGANAPTSLAAGAAIALTSWTHTFTNAGTYQVRACADIGASGESYLDETDESNNCGPYATVVASVEEDDEGAGGGSACGNGEDDDGDGLVDTADYGCSLGAGSNESPNPQCSDGIDNDGNGLDDYSTNPVLRDPLCSSFTDNSEFVTTAEQPNLTLTAQPARVQSGKTTTIEWSTTNVQDDSCSVSENSPTINDAWGGDSGEQTTSALEGETTYTLTCRNLSGALVSKSVTVSTAPTVREE